MGNLASQVLRDARHGTDREVTGNAATDLEEPDRGRLARSVIGLVPFDERLELLRARLHARVVRQAPHHDIGSEDVPGRGILPSGSEHRDARLPSREHP